MSDIPGKVALSKVNTLAIKLDSDLSGKVDKVTGSRLITSPESTLLGNTSNSNSGDETATTIKTKLGITILTGDNTGDQTLTGLPYASSAQGNTADTAVQSVKINSGAEIKSGTNVNLPAYPTTLPADGGNADTVDSKHASDILLLDQTTPQTIINGTPIIPSINGSVAANGDLTLQGTTDGTRTTSYVNIQPNGGNVGIGTTAPKTRLNINTDSNENNSANSKISTYADSNSIYGIGFSHYSNYGLGLFSGQALDGSPAIMIENTGNVGIGTTTPIDYVSTAKNIQIVGTTYSALTLGASDSSTNNKFWRNIIRSSTSGAAVYQIQTIDDSGGTEITALQITRSGNSVTQTVLPNGNVGIGTTTPNANAILDVTSTTKAFMPPRMTSTQKNAISSPTEGMAVWDLTTHTMSYYNGTAWI